MPTKISRAPLPVDYSSAQSAPTFLHSKLNKPAKIDLYCERQSLLDAFAEGIGRRLTVVQAPAGYGKTQALLAWISLLETRGINASWLLVDEGDNDVTRFLRYLIESIRLSIGDVGKGTLLSLEALNELTTDSPTSFDVEAVLTPLIRDLAAQEKSLVICLDGLQAVENTQTWQCITFLIEHLPPQVSLLLSSRFALPINLNPWALSQQLLHMGVSLFEWSKAESKQLMTLLSTASVKKLTDEDKAQDARWIEDAQGWVAGMHLLAMQRNGIYASDTFLYASTSLLHQYFKDEVLTFCDAADLLRLSQLARLPQFNREMCSALFGHEGEHLLGTLITRQLFLCKIDEQSGWYSFHPLFKHMLLAENEESQDAFYLKVSVWYEQKGLGVGAIDYALMANDPQRAAKLAESMTESILADQDIQRLKRWRKALPNSLISTSPHLTLLFSWAAALAMQLDDAEQLIEQIDFTKYDGAYEGRVLAIEGYIARGRGDITRCIELCELALVMMKGHSTVVSVLVMSALGNAYLTLKDVKQSEYYNQASLELARRSSDGGLEMLALYDGARIEMAKGQLKTAQRLLNSAQQIHKGMGLFPTTAIYGRILMTQGSVAWLQNDVDKAQDFLKEGIRLAEDCHDVAVLIGYIVHSALLRQQRRYDEAMDLLFRAERTMQVWNVPRGIYNGWISAVRANLWIDQGKVSLAEECLSTLRSMNDAAPEYFPALPGCIDLFYARVKVAAEDYDGALFILDRLVKDFQSNQFGFNHTLCLLLRALVLYHTKNESAALSDLNEALRYAEPENCISPFLEYSDKLLPVIKKIPSPSVEYDFLQKLLKQIDVSDEPTSAPETGLIALSARELGVLKLIAQGCSNQDIADKLYISLHTVKTHARKINNKLVSKSRTQAIVKARELGLI